MANPNLPFDRAEYAARLTKTRQAMAARGLDAIFVTDPSNMAWLTGYDGWSFYMHQGVLLGLEGAPIWWGRAMDANGAKRATYLGDDNIRVYEDTYVQNPAKHPMQDLCKLIADEGLNKTRIRFEMDNYYFTASAWIALQKGLPQAQMVDATALVNWQRAAKSPREIEYMRRAARIVGAMHQVVLERAEPGMRKNDLIAEIYRTSVAGADGHWGDYPAIVPMAPSGADATAPHLTWDDSPLREGESTFFEIAGAHRRYQCPQSRTLFLGKPPQKFLDAEKAVLEVVEAGLAEAKPGNLCEDIARAFNEALNRLGFEKDSRCGYTIGLSYPPDWGECTMSFRRCDKTVLQPGMTFHFMPALWLDDGGLEITEPIVITQTGLERLFTTPRELFIKASKYSKAQRRKSRRRGPKQTPKEPDMLTNDQLSQWDREAFFHPSTHLAQHARGETPSRIITGASGVHIEDRDGRKLLDAFAGLYCVNAGYGRQEIAEAIAEQARNLAYYHSYVGHGTEASITLAKMVLDRAPKNMSKVYFGLSGSDANETNVKLIWYYNNILGRPKKKKIISRWRGYHGSGLGRVAKVVEI